MSKRGYVTVYTDSDQETRPETPNRKLPRRSKPNSQRLSRNRRDRTNARYQLLATSAITGSPIQVIPLAFIPIKLDGIEIYAMIDTGSSVSFVSDHFATGAHLCRTLRVHLANGSVTPVNTAKNVTITLGTQQLEFQMHVLHSMPLPVILGMDFLTQFGIKIDPRNRRIELSDSSFVKFDSKKRSKIFNASLVFNESDSIAAIQRPNAPTTVAAKDEFPRPTVGNAQMSYEQRIQAQALLDELKDAFTSRERPVGNVTTIYHRVFPEGEPFKAKVAALSPAQINVQRACIAEMLKYGVVKESKSEWASRPSFAPKPDGSVRFCLNFRRLNQVVTKDSYPLPRAPELINQLTECRYFTKLDAAHGYWQIPIHPDETKYTAVITEAGLFEFLRMPFGLSNAPATYQRLMDKTLAKGLRQFCCVYLDDVLVFSRTFEEHIEHVRQCITWMAEVGLLLKARKSSFFEAETEYLGFIIGNGTIKMTHSKMRNIIEFPIPSDIKGVQSFLGVTGYYRRFIKNYGTQVSPLHDLTRRDQVFKWTAEHQRIFQDIQEQFNKNIVLQLPDYTQRFIIDTDASDIGIGAVLSQIDKDGRERPVMFASRKLSTAELKWPVRDKEALAIIYALDTFRAYVLGSRIPTLVRTDHHSLQWMQDAKTGRIARWATVLAEYEPFEIKYRTGSSNKVADALSRVFAWSECLPDIAFCGTVLASDSCIRMGNPFDLIAKPTTMQLYNAQRACKGFCLPRLSDPTKYPSFSTQLYLNTDTDKEMELLGILVDGRFRPVLPDVLVDKFIKSIHANPLVAHMGAKRTAARCAELFIIQKLRLRTRLITSSCLACIKRKTVLPKVGKLSSMAPTQPWEMISMDFCGPYPKSNRGNAYVLVIIDQFSKYVNLIPCLTADSGSVLRALYERIICQYGTPQKLLTDNGSHFVNSQIASICHAFRIFKVQSSPYYPQGDGQVERFMRNMNDSLSALCQGNVHDWCDFIAGVQSAYNSTPHAATCIAPYEVIYGRKVQPLVRLDHIPANKLVTESALAYAKRHHIVVENIRSKVELNVRLAWMRRAIQFNAGRSKITITVGQRALVRLTPLQLASQPAKKLKVRWSEPVLVTGVKSSGNAFDVTDEAGRTFVVNATRLLPMPPKSWQPQRAVGLLRWNEALFEPIFESTQQCFNRTASVSSSLIQLTRTPVQHLPEEFPQAPLAPVRDGVADADSGLRPFPNNLSSAGSAGSFRRQRFGSSQSLLTTFSTPSGWMSQDDASDRSNVGSVFVELSSQSSASEPLVASVEQSSSSASSESFPDDPRDLDFESPLGNPSSSTVSNSDEVASQPYVISLCDQLCSSQ